MKKLVSLATLAALSIAVHPAGVYAHTESNDLDSFSKAATVVIVEPEIFLSDIALPFFLEIKTTADRSSIDGLTPFVEIQDENENVIFADTALEQGDYYYFEHTFPEPGEYAAIVSFEFDGENIIYSFTLPVITPTGTPTPLPVYLIWGIAGALALIVLIAGAVKKRLKRAIVWALIFLILGTLGYSLYITFTSGARTAGIVTCTEDGSCFWTAHIHGYVPITICDEEYRLPTEKGRLDRPHTHEEKNIIHWHDKLPYDQNERRITELEPLTLGAFFNQVDIPFSEIGIAGRANGETCPDGTVSSLKMFINGEPSTAYRDYIWNDRDVIHIFFDGQSSATIQETLHAAPIVFPKLGRG